MSYLKLTTASTTTVLTRQADQSLSKSAVWVERSNFYRAGEKNKNTTFGLFSIDTEFEADAEDPFSDDEVKGGKATNTILSYQFCCRIYDESQPDAAEWSGICFPEPGGRLRMADLFIFALSEGLKSGALKKAPLDWYLVAHFTRADMPAFADFKDLNAVMTAVRGTFITVGGSIPLPIDFDDGDTAIKIALKLRDTMLLLPEGSKSLKAMGDMIHFPKIELDPDPAKEREYKRHMSRLMAENPALFDKYAINDAIVAARYADIVMHRSKDTVDKFALPVTLTGNAVQLLLSMWEKSGQKHLDIMGKEIVKEKLWNPKLGRYRVTKEEVFIDQLHAFMPMANEAYHGGRGEQYWFGPSYEADWTDYDLSGAYPTAMALIRTPDWSSPQPLSKTSDLENLTCETLGAFCVDFEFPAGTRFPTLPVRTVNGLIFPLKGRSNCGAPEVVLARQLGAQLKLVYGVVIPPKDDALIFGDFIKFCIGKRYSAPKDSVDAKFWKEYSNATYGKTAQGLREKRAYDNREDDTKPLPPSPITNAFFACFITSFVRAALGEILNALPPTVCVFSCTTDGFLTDATQSQIDAASKGLICTLFGSSRANLTGNDAVLEIKHQVRKLIGWRTRGQATLTPGQSSNDPDKNTVLAKGGIWTTEDRDTRELRNEFIVQTFFGRTADSKIRVVSKTGIRDIVRYGADLVEKVRSKRLNMEFDWKRRPTSVVQSADPDHVCFSTQPWETVAQFNSVRDHWEAYAKDTVNPIKTAADYKAFATFLLTKTALLADKSGYFASVSPDLKRLRQRLASAWRHSAAGLTWQEQGLSNADFAVIVAEACGIKCSRADVENGGKKPFAGKTVPPTPDVFAALKRLAVQFPGLQIAEFVAPVTDAKVIDMLPALDKIDSFTGRVASKP